MKEYLVDAKPRWLPSIHDHIPSGRRLAPSHRDHPPAPSRKHFCENAEAGDLLTS